MSSSLHEIQVTLDLARPIRLMRPHLLNETERARYRFQAPKYRWASQHYWKACANHWVPSEIWMESDAEVWNSNALSPAQRGLFKRYLGFFGDDSSLLGDNVTLALYRNIASGEVRQYLLQQAHEEGVRLRAFQQITEALGIDPDDLGGSYRRLFAGQASDRFWRSLTEKILRPDFRLTSVRGQQELLQGLIGFYPIRKGLSYTSTFLSLLSFHRLGMTGTAEQFRHIVRDNEAHVEFGVELINGIRFEYPEAWTASLRAEIVKTAETAIATELDFACNCDPEGILGLSHGQLSQYLRFVAQRWLGKIGLKFPCEGKNPFPWMEKMSEPTWRDALMKLSN